MIHLGRNVGNIWTWDPLLTNERKEGANPSVPSSPSESNPKFQFAKIVLIQLSHYSTVCTLGLLRCSRFSLARSLSLSLSLFLKPHRRLLIRDVSPTPTNLHHEPNRSFRLLPTSPCRRRRPELPKENAQRFQCNRHQNKAIYHSISTFGIPIIFKGIFTVLPSFLSSISYSTTTFL